MGCVRHGTEQVTRIVKISNEATQDIFISGWRVSCECLSVTPHSLALPAGSSRFIQLAYDADDSESEFRGELLITVEALAGDDVVGKFDVPLSVISDDDVASLAQPTWP